MDLVLLLQQFYNFRVYTASKHCSDILYSVYINTYYSIVNITVKELPFCIVQVTRIAADMVSWDEARACPM